MVSLLPLKLIETIIDHLDEAGDDDLDNDPFSSLKAFSLVCCSFLAPCQSHLFATISLRPPCHSWIWNVGCGWVDWKNFNSTHQLKSSIAAFSCMTAASPHLLGYVCCLNLYGSPYPLNPLLPPARHTEWLSSQSHHLMTFIPNLTPKLRGFGIYNVDWNELSPKVLDPVNSIFESTHLTSLTIVDMTNIPITVLASCVHLQHFTLESYQSTWDDSALTWGPASNYQKPRLTSLKLFTQDSIIDWFSMENCLFNILHLCHLVLLWGDPYFMKNFQICSSSLESFMINS